MLGISSVGWSIPINIGRVKVERGKYAGRMDKVGGISSVG